MEIDSLVPIATIDAVALFTGDGLDAILEQIRQKALDFNADPSISVGRKEIASMAHKVARSKVLLDDLGKQLVADWKSKSKKVDAARKHARDYLDALKAEVRRPLTDWEMAEAQRIAYHNTRLSELRDLFDPAEQYSAKELWNRYETLENTQVDSPAWEEFAAEAEKIRSNGLEILADRIDRQEKYEAEQAELERLRREKAEREVKEAAERHAREKHEREERIRREAEDRAKREAAAREAQLKAAAERAERERIAAEERAKAEKERRREAEAAARRQAAQQAQENLRELKRALSEHEKEPIGVALKIIATIPDHVHKNMPKLRELLNAIGNSWTMRYGKLKAQCSEAETKIQRLSA